MDTKCFRLEWPNAGTNDRSAEHTGLQFINTTRSTRASDSMFLFIDFVRVRNCFLYDYDYDYTTNSTITELSHNCYVHAHVMMTL